MKHSALLTAITAGILLAAPAASAEDYVITLKDHQFSPKELTVPANEKGKIIVKNEDATAAEFESHDLDREKVIGPNSSATLLIGPLAARSYEYFDEFHEDAKGTIIAK